MSRSGISRQNASLSGDMIYVEGLYEQLCRGYDEMLLLSEQDSAITATVFQLSG